MLAIQAYLRGHSVGELAAGYAVTARRHPGFGNLVMLKYSQLNSPLGEELVRQCRGIILDEAAGWAVVSHPYDKFFNWGEPLAAGIDWGTASVFEKLDGSLMTMYFYRGEWRVASSGMPDAGGAVNDSSSTFAELFWETWRALGYSLPVDTGRCYMFELMTEHNRVVVRHAKARIVLHGARSIVTDLESTAKAAAVEGWEVVRTFALGTAKECLAAAALLPPMEGEGYVVCDGAFRRAKIKSAKYAALALLKEGFNARQMLELARTNEGDEFLSYFPELRPAYERTRAGFDSLLGAIDGVYGSLRGISGAKEFAAEAVKSPYGPVLFALRNKKAATARDFLAGATIQAVEKLMQLHLDSEEAKRLGCMERTPGMKDYF